MTKKEYMKKYNDANKEKYKAYREANKERISIYNKAHYKATFKDDHYTVYYLPEEHYAGMTSRLTHRLNFHKNNYNRHIENVEIVGKYETKAEATRVEAALHSMGYLGRNPIHKQQTLKELI